MEHEVMKQVEALQGGGKLSSSQGEAWLAGLMDASTADTFFFAGLLFTVCGRKP